MCAVAQIQLRVSSTFELKVFAINTVITIPVRLLSTTLVKSLPTY